MDTLGTLDELPADYLNALASCSLAPLWPQMRALLPRQSPAGRTRACHWRYADLRPLLLEAGRLTPVEKAERRVLVLADPGRGTDAMQLSASIYCGMQLLLPGELAPAHRHTPSAARIVVEGHGALTVVDGEPCPMEPGDLILTPGGMWHEHRHEGSEPVIWLDALDLPLFVDLEASYAQDPASDASETTTLSPWSAQALRERYPRLRFAWRDMRAQLDERAADGGVQHVEIEYLHPGTGASCLHTLGFTAIRLEAGSRWAPHRRSASAAFHVVEGTGRTRIDDAVFEWKSGDTFSAPVFASVAHEATAASPAFMICVHDRPLQEKLGFYEERAA